MPDDVRVRLSPEGVAEVIDALQRIQTKSALVSRQSASNIASFGGALKTLRGGLAAVGVALSVGAVTRYVQGATEGAEKTVNLSRTIGASVVNFQALRHEASLSGADLEAATVPLTKFAKLTNEVLRGDKQALGLLKAVGLTKAEIQSLAGQDTIGRLDIVGRRFAALADGPAKAELAVAVFGRQVENLTPILNTLGEKGLKKIVDDARELGVVIDESALRSLDSLGDELQRTKTVAGAVAAQFLGQLAPTILDGMASISGSLRGNEKSWKFWGGLVRIVLIGIVQSVDTVVTGIKLIVDGVVGASRITALLMRRDFAGVALEAKRLAELEGKTSRKLEERTEARSLQVRGIQGIGPPAPPELAKPEPDNSLLDAEKAGKLRADAEEAAIKLQLAKVKAGLKLREEAEQRSFDQGLRSLTDHYAKRRAFVEDARNAELAALAQEEIAVRKNNTGDALLAKLRQIEAEKVAARTEATSKIGALNHEENEKVKQLLEDQRDVQRRAFEARGREHDAELIRINEEIRKIEELNDKLKGQGGSEGDSKRKRDLEDLRGALTARASFNEASRQATQALEDLAATRSRLEAQAQAGILSQADAERQVLELEKERVDTLEVLGAQLQAAAAATGDPAAIAQAQAFVDSLIGIQAAARESDKFLVELSNTGFGAATEAASEFLTVGGGSMDQFGQRVRSAAASVVSAVQQMIAKFIALKLVTAAFSLFGRGGGLKGTIFSGDVPSTPAAAGGGLLRGPGTSKSDSILVQGKLGKFRGSVGEYVTKAERVREPGTLSFLSNVNTFGLAATLRAQAEGAQLGAVFNEMAGPGGATAGFNPITSMPRIQSFAPGFAEGGHVAPADIVPGAAIDRTEVNGEIRVGISKDLILETMKSPAGQKVQIRTLSENRRGIRSILGG